jgi:hypothetical protein
MTIQSPTVGFPPGNPGRSQLRGGTNPPVSSLPLTPFFRVRIGQDSDLFLPLTRATFFVEIAAARASRKLLLSVDVESAVFVESAASPDSDAAGHE